MVHQCPYVLVYVLQKQHLWVPGTLNHECKRRCHSDVLQCEGGTRGCAPSLRAARPCLSMVCVIPCVIPLRIGMRNCSRWDLIPQKRVSVWFSKLEPAFSKSPAAPSLGPGYASRCAQTPPQFSLLAQKGNKLPCFPGWPEDMFAFPVTAVHPG